MPLLIMLVIILLVDDVTSENVRSAGIKVYTNIYENSIIQLLKRQEIGCKNQLGHFMTQNVLASLFLLNHGAPSSSSV